MREITCKGGPLNGLSYLVPEAEDQIPAEGGHYEITAKGATWHPTRTAKDTPEEES